MPLEKAPRRMTLRQLLTHAEKCSRDLIEHLQSSYVLQIADFRDLSRPVRRRSHFPAMVAVHNALKKLVAAHAEVENIASYLHEQMETIREHAMREKVNRL